MYRQTKPETRLSDNERTRLPRFHEPKAPRFVLTDRQGKFALGIGGYVRATAEYDFGGIVKDVDFYPALIPNKGSADRARNQFQMDISTSTLFLKLVGHTKRLGDFVVYTAANFRGDGKPSNCKMLMPPSSASLWDTVMVTLWTWPPTAPIDFAGPNGSAFYRTTQLSYMCDKLKIGNSASVSKCLR